MVLCDFYAMTRDADILDYQPEEWTGETTKKVPLKRGVIEITTPEKQTATVDFPESEDKTATIPDTGDLFRLSLKNQSSLLARSGRKKEPLEPSQPFVQTEDEKQQKQNEMDDFMGGFNLD